MARIYCRSLSSSQLEMLKDEFLVGPTDTKTTEADKFNRDKSLLHRQITHDGKNVRSDHLPSDYIENILMEQSTFYNDGKYSNVEVHRVKTGKEVTRTETTVTSLPKPPPSFIIPRSRSKSPSPYRELGQRANLKSLPIDSSNYNRLSAPPVGVGSRSSSTDSSPVGNYPSTFIPSSTQRGLLGAGALQSGSLDRLSPGTARRKFFETPSKEQPMSNTWSNRGRNPYKDFRNSKSLSNSTEFNNSLSGQGLNVNGQFNGPLRSSVSMDDGSITRPELEIPKGVSGGSKESIGHGSGKHSSGFKDMFNAMKRKLKPKIKRSQSARDHDMLRILEEKERQKSALKETERQELDVSVQNEIKTDNSVKSLAGVPKATSDSKERSDSSDKLKGAEGEEKQEVHQKMTPIKIPDNVESGDAEKVDDTASKKVSTCTLKKKENK